MTTSASAAAPETPQSISDRAWIVTLLGIVALIVGLNLLLAWKLDIFGILRDPHGRQLRTSRHERQAKYLLNFKYVPENFDALVVGTSSSLNWRLDHLTGYRFYNESLLGADGVEEREYVDKALERGHFKVALVAISSGLTDRHDLQDGLDQADPREALGSFYSYIMMIDRALHPTSQYGADGCWQMAEHPPDFGDMSVPYKLKGIDRIAFDNYRTAVQDLLAHGVRVVYFISPHYGLDINGAGPQIAQYDRTILSGLPPAPVINLNAPEYKYLWDNPGNYIDVDHLSPAGADLVTSLINQHMHEALHDR